MTDFNDHFAILIYRMGLAEKTFVNNQLKKYRVTVSYARILKYVEGHPGCVQKGVAEELHYQPASLTNMLKRMEYLGMINRRLEKGAFPHAKRIYLLEYGRQIVANVDASFDKLNRLIGTADSQPVAQLKASLAKLNAYNQQN